MPKYLLLLTALFTLVLNIPHASAGDFPDVIRAGDITYTSGGIGDDEKTALDAVGKQYNLHILSAYSNGEYIEDVNIVISDNRGNAVLRTDAGPIFYAALPLGKYVVEGSFNGISYRQVINLKKGKTSNIDFRWKDNEPD